MLKKENGLQIKEKELVFSKTEFNSAPINLHYGGGWVPCPARLFL